MRDSPGPVFYRGVRVGRGGREFKIFKFRSMVVDADKSGVTSTSGGDSRITSSGHFIRKWKLDELAQLVNVVMGDMSLVGPRPEVKEFTDLYSGEEIKILTLKPGITDWASIWNSDEGGVLEGAEDPDAVYLEVIRPIKIELQLFYSKTRSFIGDLRIIFYTVRRVFDKAYIPEEIKRYPDYNELRERAVLVMSKKQKGKQTL